MIEKTKSGSRVGITLVGAFATIAGIGEIIVGLTGNYLGILAHSIPPATSTIIIGAFYSLGGLAILTMRKLGAALGILFIACEVLGRLYLVMIGIAPSTGGDALKIAIGGLIALAVIGYVASQWKKFDEIARMEADGASRWRSFMNWSNSARSLATRRRFRNSLNSRCSSSRRRNVSAR